MNTTDKQAVDTIHLFHASTGEWRWRRRNPEGKTVAESIGFGDRALALLDVRTTNGFDGYRLTVGHQ